MINESTIKKTREFIRNQFQNEGSGHDWWHIWRVWKMALRIAREEEADTDIVQMAALLHDIGDHKLFNNPVEEIENLKNWLKTNNLSDTEIDRIIQIVENISFKGSNVQELKLSPEGQIVQDADRLDALGAIGIARTFAYGGMKNRLIYDPDRDPEDHFSFDDYKNSTGPTINHFYEKLLLLKDRMHTKTARKIADERHAFMEEFLKRFYKEWNE